MAEEQSMNLGALPDASNQQQTAAAGLQIQALLGQRAQVDQAISTTLPSALAPVKTSGTTTPTLPGAFQFNPKAPQMPAPQGHADARNQGIAKIITGVTGIVGKIVQAKKAEKQRDLAHDIERVMGAQDSMSQAQVILQSDPNNKDAKASLDKSKQIINDTISADPKKLKQFEKAFDINFLDPSKNTTDEHGALKQASKSYADQLAAKTPDKLVPNQPAIAKVQALDAQGKAIDSQIKAIMPAYVQQQRDVAAAQRVQELQAGANARADATNQTRVAIANQTAATRAADRAERWQSAQLSSKTRYGVAGLNAKNAMDRTMKQIEGRQTAIDKLKGSKPEQAAKLDATNAKTMQAQLKDSAQTITNLRTAQKDANADQKPGYDKAIQQVEMDQREAASWLQNYNERTNAQAHGKPLISDEKGGPQNVKPAAIAGRDEEDTDDNDTFDDQSKGDPTDPDSDYYN